MFVREIEQGAKQMRCDGVQTVAESLASAVVLWNCYRRIHCADFSRKWSDAIDKIMVSAPSGGGIESGMRLDRKASGGDRLVFHARCDHSHRSEARSDMTNHRITARASYLMGFSLKVGGRDRHDIKAHINYSLREWLSSACIDD